ncbi:MAG TPA: ubiquitin-like protein Pup [Mycobacteriales bacterium]|jgi:ubiquitin-like protein Pup|nr:ubiquitin-like protein Pup [Mycobacteriales bacterium]
MPTQDEGGQSRATRKAAQDDEVVDVAEATSEVSERNAKLTDDVDDLLDEIDDVLEENAEDFVRSYVQKGGQ